MVWQGHDGEGCVRYPPGHKPKSSLEYPELRVAKVVRRDGDTLHVLEIEELYSTPEGLVVFVK